MPNKPALSSLPAIKVEQWLPEWDELKWSSAEHRSRPPRAFYQFSIAASSLKALSGVYSRSTKQRKRGVEDLGIQRRHEPERSREITEFVRYGYPWSALSKSKRSSDEFKSLRKPGWLPTAIVVNILRASDRRRGEGVEQADLVSIVDLGQGQATVHLPNRFSGAQWRTSSLPPIEVIDGQHRLWAFENSAIGEEFQLPVVAFVGLDISWQAYLFYTINIKPKKINPSLAFDLYPLLRTEDWLAKFEGHIVYRETRAQEIVDLLWSQPRSPWHRRINMLGDPGMKGKMVTQSAWIRSLLATYVKRWEGPGIKIGGLFGAPVGSHDEALPWSRIEQAAFLIFVGDKVRSAVKKCEEKWAVTLRADVQSDLVSEEDPAFYGAHTLLNQDQGIRVLLHISNDLLYVASDDIGLASWSADYDPDLSDDEKVSAAIDSLNGHKPIAGFVEQVASAMAAYDWRASSAPGLEAAESLLKAAFRGSGGYKELRKNVLQSFAHDSEKQVQKRSKIVLSLLGYE